MRITVDTDVVLDRLQLEKYGIGIPALFLAFGIALLIASVPGMASFGSLTGYGRLGLAIVVVLSVSSLFAAGYTYRSIDKTWWVLDKWRDGPEGIREGTETQADEA